jgi:hypothetical protein
MTMPRNLIGGILTVLIGVGYLAMAYQLRVGALSDTVGPAGFPKVLGYAVVGLGLILCAQSVAAMLARRSALPLAAGGPAVPAATEAEDKGGGDAGDSLRGVLKAGGMLAIGIVYLLVVRWLGYVPSVALLMIAAAIYLGTPFSLRVVGIGIAGALVYWIVFVWVLGIPLPPGILGNLF